MANSNGMREVLMKEFAENYMEPLYYFCLKKTGDSYEAWEMPEYLGMSQNAAGNPDTMYWQYIPGGYGFKWYDPEIGMYIIMK